MSARLARDPIDNATYFTIAFFHAPVELRAEVGEAGFDPLAHAGLEGPGPGPCPPGEPIPGRRIALLSLLERLETNPLILGRQFSHTRRGPKISQSEGLIKAHFKIYPPVSVRLFRLEWTNNLKKGRLKHPEYLVFAPPVRIS